MNKKHNILAIIPARGGSKGILKKNIKQLSGKPLIEYTINAAKQSKLINHLIVSTDDEDIKNISLQLNVDVPFLRPKHLATDDSGSLGLVQHALDFFEKKDLHFDAVVLLQPTTPFRTKNLIDEAIKKFLHTECDALVSVLKVPHQYHPHWTFFTSKENFLRVSTGEQHIISRRQALPEAFFRDGSIYITKTEVIKKGSLYGKKLSYIENSDKFYVNIDTEKDWGMAELMVNEYVKSIKNG